MTKKVISFYKKECKWVDNVLDGGEKETFPIKKKNPINLFYIKLASKKT